MHLSNAATYVVRVCVCEAQGVQPTPCPMVTTAMTQQEVVKQDNNKNMTGETHCKRLSDMMRPIL